MNSSQRQVLGWAIAIFLVFAAFPPWTRGSEVEYSFIFSPPYTHNGICGSRLVFQWFVLAVVVAGLLVLKAGAEKREGVAPVQEPREPTRTVEGKGGELGWAVLLFFLTLFCPYWLLFYGIFRFFQWIVRLNRAADSPTKPLLDAQAAVGAVRAEKGIENPVNQNEKDDGRRYVLLPFALFVGVFIQVAILASVFLNDRSDGHGQRQAQRSDREKVDSKPAPASEEAKTAQSYLDSQYAQDFIQKHSNWLFQHDSQGNVLCDRATGKRLLTPYGQRFLDYLNEAERIGIKGLDEQANYALRMVRSEYLGQGRGGQAPPGS